MDFSAGPVCVNYTLDSVSKGGGETNQVSSSVSFHRFIQLQERLDRKYN